MDFSIFWDSASKTATIVGIIVGTGAIIGFGLSQRQKIRKRNKESKRDLSEKLDLLEDAGTTVAARSDLAMYVTIELDSLRYRLNASRHNIIIYCILTVFIGTIVIFDSLLNVPDDLLILKVALSGILLNCLLFTTSMINVLALERFIYSCEDRLKQIWKKPIAKRLSKQIEDIKDLYGR